MEKKTHLIESLMKDIYISGADKMVLQGQVYPEFFEREFYWQISGEKYYYGINDKEPVELDKISEILRENLNYEHFIFSINKSGKVDFQKRYIPEEDSWTDLYMKKVSELTEEEWQETNIPKEDWEERKALVALPDSERIPIILGRDLQARLNNRKLITLEVELENTPIVKVTILSEDGTEKILNLPEVSVNWFIKQSTELRDSPPYQKTPWSKIIMTVDKTGKFKTNFKYDD